MTFLLPVRKLTEGIIERIINPFMKVLVNSLITNLLYVPVITICMVFTMNFIGNQKINAEIEQRQEQLEKINDSLVALQDTGLQNGRVENYTKQKEQLEKEIEEIGNGRPEPSKTI